MKKLLKAILYTLISLVGMLVGMTIIAFIAILPIVIFGNHIVPYLLGFFITLFFLGIYKEL